jgi:hypothetical protein
MGKKIDCSIFSIDMNVLTDKNISVICFNIFLYQIKATKARKSVGLNYD